MKLVFTIWDAKVRHANGVETPKELYANVTSIAEDGDGSHFPVNDIFAIPIPYRFPIGDRHDLIGKKITIEVDI